MSEETTQTPLYKEIFTAFEAGVEAERTRQMLNAASFPLANVRAFPMVAGAYFDPEGEFMKSAIETPTEGLERMAIGEYVTALTLSAGTAQVHLTNISGAVHAMSTLSTKIGITKLGDSDADELTEYLFTLMRTIPSFAQVQDPAYVLMIDGEEGMEKATVEDVNDTIRSAITAPYFAIKFDAHQTVRFAIWESEEPEESERPSVSGTIVFTSGDIADQMTAPVEADSDEEATEE